MGRQEIFYGLHMQEPIQTAVIERLDLEGEVLTAEVAGYRVRAHLDTSRCLEDGDVVPPAYRLMGVGTKPAIVSRILLYAFRMWGSRYGALVPFELEGRGYVARYEEHPGDRDHPKPHTGVTVFTRLGVAPSVTSGGEG